MKTKPVTVKECVTQLYYCFQHSVLSLQGKLLHALMRLWHLFFNWQISRLSLMYYIYNNTTIYTIKQVPTFCCFGLIQNRNSRSLSPTHCFDSRHFVLHVRYHVIMKVKTDRYDVTDKMLQSESRTQTHGSKYVMQYTNCTLTWKLG